VFLEASTTAELDERIASARANERPLFDALHDCAQADVPPEWEALAKSVAAARDRSAELRPLLVSSIFAHEAGAGAVDELAILVSSGIEQLRGISDAGAPLADLPRRMLFALAVDPDFFVGIAKLRAARWLWSKVLRTLGVDGAEQGMIVLARGSRRSLAALDVHTNVLRGTASAFAAIVGGADLISIPPHDAALGTASASAERLSRNIQLVLREEGQLARVIDPAGGSYFLEALTEKLARRAWAVVQEIEHLGGALRAMRDGSLAERLAGAADARRSAMAKRERAMVGVNEYPSVERIESVPEAASGPCAAMRDAEAFERLRASAQGLSVSLVAVGDARALRPRVAFAREALEVAGLSVDAIGPVARAEDAGEIGARAVVLCAADADYAALLEALAPKLEGRHVVLARAPSDELRADAFLHAKADRIEVLSAIATAARGAPREGAEP
jgi:methylmalonyl-CoA mutase